MKKKIILIQPRMGFLGEFVVHPPLSLLYVASYLVKKEYEVVILDMRVMGHKWKEQFESLVDNDVLLVGCTVMTGTPIIDAIHVSKIAKRKGITVVWGGAHPTILPEQTLSEEFIDFVIRGFGAEAILQLAEFLSKDSNIGPDAIPGLSYKKNGRQYHNPVKNEFEIIYWKDIPYNLINDYSVYRQLDHTDIVFPVYSVYGCPYKCGFCISPARYKDIKKKWIPIPTDELAEHINFLIKNFQATFIYFYDEDSFVRLDHIEKLIDKLNEKGINVKLGFRGARIDEILRMNDVYLDKLSKAGTRMLHVGLESGSQKILDIYKKGFKVNAIIEANRLLAKNKNINVLYNWIVGTPTETIEDLKATKKIIFKVIKDNPKAIIPRPNLLQPLPGTDMFDLAVKHGYKPPQKLTDWIDMEQNVGDFKAPWISLKVLKYINLLYLGSFFIDLKMLRVTEGRSLFLKIVKYLSILYYPLIRLRLSFDCYHFLIEYKIFRLLTKILNKS